MLMVAHVRLIGFFGTVGVLAALGSGLACVYLVLTPQSGAEGNFASIGQADGVFNALTVSPLELAISWLCFRWRKAMFPVLERSLVASVRASLIQLWNRGLLRLSGRRRYLESGLRSSCSFTLRHSSTEARRHNQQHQQNTGVRRWNNVVLRAFIWLDCLMTWLESGDWEHAMLPLRWFADSFPRTMSPAKKSGSNWA